MEELHKQLASLRKEAAALLKEGATPLQVLHLRRSACVCGRRSRPGTCARSVR